jgi:26S proteasome regulatory subunit T4
MTTLTIMRALPREVDPVVFHMLAEDPGNVDYSTIGGLNEQIRELREVQFRNRTEISRLSNFP